MLLTSTKCPSWLYQVTMGATTTWERWDSMRPDRSLNPGGMTSFNHYALGSVAEWMHAHIGGLEVVEPGWKRFRVAPIVGGGLNEASTTHVTPYGRAAVSWKVADGGSVMDLTVTVPVGTTAVVAVPDHDAVELDSGIHTLQLHL